MSILFDTAVDGGSFSGSGPSLLSYTHTCTGSNLILWVGIYYRVTSSTITVTYNGLSMTQATSNSSGTEFTALFYLANAPSGSHSVVVNSTASITSGQAVSVSYTGSNISPTIVSHTNSGTLTNPATFTDTLTTTKNNSWALMFIRATAGTFVAGTGTTSRISAGADTQFLDTNGPVTPAGSVSLNVNTASPSDTYIIQDCMSSFDPVSLSNGNFLMFM